jgi:hypothetical protein
MVSFYRPCLNHNPGARTVLATQRRALQNMDDDRDPRDAFLEDLRADLLAWSALGDALIVCGDINDNILSQATTNFFEDVGLRHLIFSKHDSSQAPATYYHNHSGKAVDGIWASPCLDLVRGGYLGKQEFPGDHRAIWFEILYAQAFGPSLPKIWKPKARRLQLRDPRCVKQFNVEYRRLVLLHNLPQRLYALECSIVNHSMTEAQQQESWDIDISATECEILAEERCRKLKMGRVHYSPATMLPRYQVAFWRIAIRRRMGGHVAGRLWTRAKKKPRSHWLVMRCPWMI